MRVRLSVLLFPIAIMSTAPLSAQSAAVVNGKPITTARVDAMVKQAAAQGRQDTPDFRKQVKDQLINQEVLYQEAEKKGFAASADVKSQIEQARQSIVIRAMILDYIKKNPVTDADVQVEYERFKAQSSGKEYLARHVLVDSEADARAIIAKLKSGVPFDSVVKASKDVGSAANGGVLDWSPATRYVKPFGDALMALQKGQITETPVKSQFGYHVIRLDDVRDAAVPPLDEVKKQIQDSLQEKKLVALQDGLRKKAVIK
ncbi:MAG: PpiC-type peptidyl-prolyl cis-trans isomerase [Gemmatimonadetes bacterium]|nr:PpiC-type peptidyl-prolyl cis-trans isomerase [Gemmatimonadota bacterium]